MNGLAAAGVAVGREFQQIKNFDGVEIECL
jgi:hypothetical protein